MPLIQTVHPCVPHTSLHQSAVLPPQVSHILNVAFGVENAFPDLFIYRTVSILDHPDADLLQYTRDCCDFIQQARREVR